MKLLRPLFLLFIAAMLFSGTQAQIVKDPTTWTFELKKIKEGTFKAIFHLNLEKDWHIWSLQAGGDGLQVSPEFTFDNAAGITPVGKVTESGKKITGPMDGVDGIVNYFEHKVDYTQVLKIEGNPKITGKLMYQVCNLQMCLPPKKKSFLFKLNEPVSLVLADSAKAIATTKTAATSEVSDTAKKDTASLAKTAGTANTIIAPAAKPNDEIKQSSIWLIFAEGLGGGLASVITPCVFAMLPMTVSFFLKRSKDRKTGIKIAMQYSLSILAIFTILGALMTVFFKADTLHAFSTNWIVNLFFFVIFLAFGVSFLGAFEISLPSSWATKMDSKANTQSFMGIFFMALTLVIVSFSCTVPFISSMIALAGSGGKIAPLVGFFGFGLGLALPFTLFALFPSLLNELGKSGGWLNVVKVTFGFVELALAMKFLSNADLQKGWRLLDREIFISIWVGLSLLLSGYLLGMFRFSHDSEMPKNDWGLPFLSVPRFFFATVAIIFSIYLIPGLWGAPLNGMGAFIPPMGTQDFVLGESSGASAAVAGKEAENTGSGDIKPVKFVAEMRVNEPPVVRKYNMTVFFDYEEALAASKKLKKPIMLDFTGINCANCRKMESGVWSQPDVMDRLQHDFILASLYCDANNVKLPEGEKYFAKSLDAQAETLGEKCQDLEITKFNSNALPTYYFVDDAEARLYDKPVNYPTDPADFVKILDGVKAQYKALHP